MGTKLCFSKSILKDDCLKFYIIACYFSICRAIVTHTDQWTIIKLRIEKSTGKDITLIASSMKKEKLLLDASGLQLY